MALIFRPTSTASATMRTHAGRLADKMRAVGQGVMHAVHGIFIFRAVAVDTNDVVTVIETPINIVSPRAWNVVVGSIKPWAGAVCVSLPEGASPLYTGAQKVEDATLVPWVTDSMSPMKLPNGTRLQVGSLPAWSAGRFNASDLYESVGSVTRTAVVSVGLFYLSADDSETRSLVVARATPFTPWVSVDVEALPDTWKSDTPTGTDDPALDMRKVCAIEFSAASLGASGDYFLDTTGFEHGVTATEWSADEHDANGKLELEVIAGILLAPFRAGDIEGDDYVLGQAKFAVVGWRMSRAPKPEEVATAEVLWSDVITPGMAGEPASIPPYAAAPPAGVIPASIAYYGSVNSVAHPGGLHMLVPGGVYGTLPTYVSLGESDIASARSTRVGADTAALIVTTGGILTAGGPTQIAYTGYLISDGSFTSGYVPTLEYPYSRSVVLAINTDESGVTSVFKLYEFHNDLFNHHSDLSEWVWAPLCPAYDVDNGNYMLCVKSIRTWEIKPSAPCPGAPPYVPLMPAFKDYAPGSSFTAANDHSFCIIDSSGGETPVDFGVYFPWVFNYALGYADNDSYPGKLFSVGAFAGFSVRSIPCCQYSPRTIAVLATLKSQYLSSVRSLYVLIVDVATATVVRVSPPLGSFNANFVHRMTLSCYEQATEDDEGVVITEGKLLIDSTDIRVPGGPYGDPEGGLFCVTGLNKISWLSSNVPMSWGVYAGNGLAPASLGVTMGAERLGVEL